MFKGLDLEFEKFKETKEKCISNLENRRKETDSKINEMQKSLDSLSEDNRKALKDIFDKLDF